MPAVQPLAKGRALRRKERFVLAINYQQA